MTPRDVEILDLIAEGRRLLGKGDHAQARKSFKKARQALIDSYADDVRRLCLVFLKGNERHVNDMVHEIFIAIFQRIEKEPPVTNIAGLLSTIAHTRSVDKIRSESAYERSVGRLSLQQERSPRREEAGNPEGYINRQWITRGLAELKADYRDLILMADVNEIPVSEIAQIQGKSQGTIQRRLNRARKKLARILESLS